MTVGPHEQAPTPDEDAPANFPADDVPALPVESDAGATRALASLLKLSPFLDLDERASGESAWRRRLCFALDLLVRLAVVVVLVGVIGAVAWKVLAPLPPLFNPAS